MTSREEYSNCPWSGAKEGEADGALPFGGGGGAVDEGGEVVEVVVVLLDGRGRRVRSMDCG